MKKLSALLTSVALLFVLSTAFAQAQDTALARIDNKVTSKKTDRSVGLPEKVSESRSADKLEVAPEVKFIVPETKERNTNQSILESKVGPNGEDLLMDKNGVYYLDEAGKKVRVSGNGLRDKPKHS